MSTTNKLKTRIGSVTIAGETHSSSALFVVAMRVLIGYAFLHTGVQKIIAAEPFNASGYLLHVTEASPASGLYEWIATTPWALDIVNIAVPWGEVLIGLALILGLFTRFAAFWGAFMMLLFYFGNWNLQHGVINSDFMYMLVFLSVGAFAAGRLLGLDSYVEDTEIVENHPRLKYLLG